MNKAKALSKHKKITNKKNYNKITKEMENIKGEGKALEWILSVKYERKSKHLLE